MKGLSRGGILWLFFVFLLFPLNYFAKENEPKIFVSFPKEVYSDEEIEIKVSISNLKNGEYDLKIAIEKEKILSEIFNKKEQKWQSSQYYLKSYFSGSSLEDNFKLRLKKQNLDFQGEADFIIRIRESGKSNYFQKKEKITILKPKITPTSLVFKTEIEKIDGGKIQLKKFLFPFFVAFSFSLVSGILALKIKTLFKIKF
jgi:hypothetical protein